VLNWMHCITIPPALLKVRIDKFTSTKMSNPHHKLAYFLALTIAIGLSACRLSPPPSGDTGNINLLMGNPSQATHSPSNSENYLISRPQYALSYSKNKGIPNWVSWELKASWIGTTERADNFSPDDELPTGWERIKPSDYTGSGFDRGHMANSADRSRSPEDNIPTFLMTNIIPQAPDNNRGVWVELENYSRQGGIGSKGLKATVGKGKVIVPAVTWKVILVLDQPNSGVAGVTKNTRTIAVIIPNKQGVLNDNWQKYVVSVQEVEKLTGYKFFTNVPSEIRDVIDKKIDRYSGSSDIQR
jgi:endonuclease G, mitochondrial